MAQKAGATNAITGHGFVLGDVSRTDNCVDPGDVLIGTSLGGAVAEPSGGEHHGLNLRRSTRPP